MEYQEAVKRRRRDEQYFPDKLNRKAKQKKSIHACHIDFPQYTVIIGWKNWCAFEPEEDENGVEPLVRRRKRQLMLDGKTKCCDHHLKSTSKTLVTIDSEDVIEGVIYPQKSRVHEDTEEKFSRQKSFIFEEVREENISQYKSMTPNSSFLEEKRRSNNNFHLSMAPERDASNTNELSNTSITNNPSNPLLTRRGNKTSDLRVKKFSDLGTIYSMSLGLDRLTRNLSCKEELIIDVKRNVARTEGVKDEQRAKRVKADNLGADIEY